MMLMDMMVMEMFFPVIFMVEVRFGIRVSVGIKVNSHDAFKAVHWNLVCGSIGSQSI